MKGRTGRLQRVGVRMLYAATDRDHRSSGAVEPSAGAGDSGRLVHHPLADAQIPVNPLVDFAVFVVGYPLGVDANPRNR